MSRHLLYMMWNERRLWIQWRGNVLHLELIWGTPINFAFLRWHQCSRLVTVLLLTLEFNQANRGSLCVWLGQRNCSACNAGESGLFLWRGGSLMGFLELRQEPGVYSRVTAGMSIRKWRLFNEIRTPFLVWRTPVEAKLGLAGQYRWFWRWVGRPSIPY